MTTPIRCITFDDITQIVINRAKIAGETSPDDLSMIQGFINEYHMTISTERNWRWRKFDRAFPFKKPLRTGTVNVTQGSKIISFSTITLSDRLLGRTLNVKGDQNFYRIIGLNVALNQAYLESEYIGTTNAAAQFKLYQYEFALPPDLDAVVQVYPDGMLSGSGQLDPINVLEFNRKLSRLATFAGYPSFWCLDGSEYVAASLPPLNEMVLNYDFLGGTRFSKSPKIRLFPIEPDTDRIIHLNYSVMVQAMGNADDQPLMPIPDRWVLVHYALYEWWKIQGNLNIAASEKNMGDKILKEMRDEHHKTDPKPKFIMDGRRFSRTSGYSSADDMFWLARQNET